MKVRLSHEIVVLCLFMIDLLEFMFYYTYIYAFN